MKRFFLHIVVPFNEIRISHVRIQRSGRGGVALGFLRNSGTDPLEKQLDPSGPIASRSRSVLLYVKSVDGVTVLNPEYTKVLAHNLNTVKISSSINLDEYDCCACLNFFSEKRGFDQ